MRPPVPSLLAALALVACGRSDRRPSSEPGAPSAATSRGPDPVLLRVPRTGGRVSAAIYPNVDSVVWRSSQAAPALARVLAFDVESGQLAAVDAKGVPMRIDLRLGTVNPAGRAAVTAPASVDGSTFFALAADGGVTRLTPSGAAWTMTLAGPAQELFPQRDGSVVVAGARGGTGRVWLLRPPGDKVVDSATVAGGARPLRTGAADRVYFAAGEELVGVGGRDLKPVPPVVLDAAVKAAVATPSGDRLYVTTAKSGEVAVVDRFQNAVARSIELPGEVRDLRMDALGRYLLARPARGDSAWVIAVGTDRVLGALPGAWREDLPLVLPDGAIATATGNDVTIADGETLRPRRTVAGGASDFWHLVLWNGFRPRAEGLDRPVTFGGGASRADTAPADSAVSDSAVAPPDSAAVPPAPPAPPETTTTVRPPRPTVPPPDVAQVPLGRGYTVQFAAAASEDEARRVADAVSAAEVRAPRVVPGQRDGQTMFRVVSGPYGSRAAAERAARATGRQFWVYEGVP